MGERAAIRTETMMNESDKMYDTSFVSRIKEKEGGISWMQI
jgi:hypothetical protein